MHVVIDKAKMRFLPIKHEDHRVIGDLIWIEAPHEHVHAAPIDHNFLAGFTDLELMLLYKNTTGQPAMRVGDQMRNILMELAERIPVRVVNKFELDRQASLMPIHRSKRYLYAPGQFTAEEKQELFSLEPVTLLKAPDEAVIAARARVRPSNTPAPATATSAPAPAAPRAARAPSGPRTGGVRELIWAVADKMWAEAGSPKDAPTVLALRKKMMAVLEADHAVKKTSSSNELGNWMKARI